MPLIQNGQNGTGEMKGKFKQVVFFEKNPMQRSAAVYKCWTLFFFFPDLYSICITISYLRNKFHFSEVHGSMNTTAPVQSKWRLLQASLTLHESRCVHTSMNLRKMKCISYIYTLFYIVFVHYVWTTFVLNLANKRRRTVVIRRDRLVITFNSRHYDMTSIERYVGQSTFACIYNFAYA